MGLTDNLLGQLTQHFGLGGDQAKAVLDKALPFLQDKLGGMSLPGLPSLPGLGGGSHPDPMHPDTQAHGEKLIASVPAADHEAHIAEVAAHAGVPPEQVRKMMPQLAAALHFGGKLS
jgi:hypothetical protein